ncbi:MAG: ketohydroxyglutarate aldolase [Chloroflexia bacterium]
MPARKKKGSPRKSDHGDNQNDTYVPVSVSIDDSYQQRFEEVLRSCADVGMQVEQKMPSVGVISGKIRPTQVAALRAVKGVSFVERDQSISLPSPDDDVQ